MSLKIVIAVEALRALITSERSIILWRGLLRVAVHLLHLRSVPAVESMYHSVWHWSHHGHVAVGIADIRQHCTW